MEMAESQRRFEHEAIGNRVSGGTEKRTRTVGILISSVISLSFVPFPPGYTLPRPDYFDRGSKFIAVC